MRLCQVWAVEVLVVVVVEEDDLLDLLDLLDFPDLPNHLDHLLDLATGSGAATVSGPKGSRISFTGSILL